MFTFPQFTEQEPKILGPLTLKQTILVGISGAIFFILYFTVRETNLLLFLFLSVLVLGTGFSLAFVKINSQDLPKVAVNFIRFNLISKTYIWKKKEEPIILSEQSIRSFKKEEKFPLKIVEKSQIKKIKSELETKI